MKRIFRFPWRTRRSIQTDVDAELRFHIETRTEALVRTGLAPDVARAQALREFGDVDDARRYLNAVDRQTESNRRRKDFMGDLIQDTIYAIRKLKSAPAFAITVIVTLAVGIGANTTVLNLINATLLKAPAVSNVDELAWVSPRERNGRFGTWAMPDAVEFRDATKSWAGLTTFGNVALTLAGDAPPVGGARRCGAQAPGALGSAATSRAIRGTAGHSDLSRGSRSGGEQARGAGNPGRAARRPLRIWPRCCTVDVSGFSGRTGYTTLITRLAPHAPPVLAQDGPRRRGHVDSHDRLLWHLSADPECVLLEQKVRGWQQVVA